MSAVISTLSGGSHGPVKINHAPTRPHYHPQFYEVFNHPLCHGRAFVASVDPAELTEWADIYRDLPVPQTTDAVELVARGWMELQPGDSVFLRNIFGSGEAKDDILRVAIVDEANVQRHCSEAVQSMKDLTQEMLGPRESRDGTSKSKGNIPFEKGERAVNSRQGERCYPTTTTAEGPRSGISHPGANLSSSLGPHEDKSLSLIRSINKVNNLSYQAQK